MLSGRRITKYLIRTLLAAIFTCIVACAIWAWPILVYSHEARSIRNSLDDLRRNRRPQSVDSNVWESATTWAITAHCNICFSGSYTALDEVKRFRVDLEMRLAGEVDLATVGWIWLRLAETGPNGRLYCKKFEPEYHRGLYPAVPFAALRKMSSFRAQVDETIYWDNKEFKIGETPELWVFVTQTNGARLKIVWQNATTQDATFARSLQGSDTYLFPGVWDESVAPRGKNVDAATAEKKTESVDVRSLLENGRKSGSLPVGMFIRVSACLGDSEGKRSGERGPQELREMWEFTSNHVHRVVIDPKPGKLVYNRVESRSFDSKELCKELIEGRAVDIQARKGTGPEIELVGTIYRRGSRSIEVVSQGETVLDLHETNGPTLVRYRESDARAFGVLYERLASQARALFK